MSARILTVLAVGCLVTALVLMGRSKSPKFEAAPTQALRPAGKTIAGPRLPAPRAIDAGRKTAESFQQAGDSHALERLLKERLPNITIDKIGAWLELNRRSADSLLAGFIVTDDAGLLSEATERYPDDPQVAFVAIFASKSGEERRRWLDALKQSAPDNSLAHYLSAGEYFKAGQTDAGVQELIDAMQKTKYEDYTVSFIVNAEEAYRAAGCTSVESKAAAMFNQPLPQLAKLKRLGNEMSTLAQSYRASGDEASALALLRMQVELGRQLGDSTRAGTIIQELVGIAIERGALELVEPGNWYDAASTTVADRLVQLARQRDEIKRLNDPLDGMFNGERQELLDRMSEEDLSNYFDRVKTLGEKEALRWAALRLGRP